MIRICAFLWLLGLLPAYGMLWFTLESTLGELPRIILTLLWPVTTVLFILAAIYISGKDYVKWGRKP